MSLVKCRFSIFVNVETVKLEINKLWLISVNITHGLRNFEACSVHRTLGSPTFHECETSCLNELRHRSARLEIVFSLNFSSSSFVIRVNLLHP